MTSVFHSERQFFHKHGYLVLRGVFGSSTVTKLRNDITGVLKEQPELSPMEPGLHKRLTSIARIMRTPVLGQIMSALMGNTAEVRLWYDQVLHSPAHKHCDEGWYQDYHGWQHVLPADLATVSIALTHSNEHTGCLHVVPGSHEWGLIEPSGGGFGVGGSDVPLRRQLSEQHRDRMTTVPLQLKPGDVSFHHCLTVHGRMANTTANDGLVYVAHCFPDHVVCRSENRDVFQFPKIDVSGGAPVRGRDFPLLWAGQAPGIKALPAA